MLPYRARHESKRQLGAIFCICFNFLVNTVYRLGNSTGRQARCLQSTFLPKLCVFFVFVFFSFTCPFFMAFWGANFGVNIYQVPGIFFVLFRLLTEAQRAPSVSKSSVKLSPSSLFSLVLLYVLAVPSAQASFE